MKAQADIVSAVIIVIIALSLVSTAYMWGLPLIQKKQDTAIVERVSNAFSPDNVNSITKKIESVANRGGEETFTLDVDGLWILYPYDANTVENNSIQFAFSSRVTNVGVDKGWIPLSSGNIGIGTLGLDDSSVVFGRADSAGSFYNITYKSWFRELDESSTKGYKINLLVDERGSDKSTGKTVRISRAKDPYSQTVGGKTLIITEIKILLV